MSSAQSARVAELEGQIAAQKPEHDAAARGAEAARASTAAAENDERLVAKKKRDLEAQRRDLDQQFKKQVGARSAGVSTAEQERHRALADVGRQLLKSRGRLADVPTDRLDALRRADRTVVERATELEKHVRALDSYDRSGMKNGLVVAAVALLVLVLGLVALVNA